jgi:hypothetical protein
MAKRSSSQLRILLLFLLVVTVGYLILRRFPRVTTARLHQDIIIEADLWSPEPEILSAGYGFDNIIGVPGEEEEVRAAGGAWNRVTCTNGEKPDRAVLTSSVQPNQVAVVYGQSVEFADGLPVVFSWPILPSTLDPTDFLVTLNTGETLVPEVASIFPNFEYNERHVAVIFADFGNRLLPGEAGARYVTKVEVVADETSLMLLGPNGPVSAVGLMKESDFSPYERGPYLVGAKLNRLSTAGEGGPQFLSGNLPNDGLALYGEEAAYRLRMYTSGGFSPDGVRGVLPTEFERFFRIHATGADGQMVLITQTQLDYQVKGGVIRVLGLAELGLPESFDEEANPLIAYDDCYREDHDNYIDIILTGDEQAMRHIAFLEIPAEGEYDPFYNPGGPGNDPTFGVRYTAPGPADLEPVIMALDDPLTVSYIEDESEPGEN